MLKWRDFYLMKVCDLKGRHIGVIEDVAIDFNKGSVVGFITSSPSLFKKNNFININSIISLNDVMMIRTLEKSDGVKFKDIKFKDIKNNEGKVLGALEDLIIEKDTFLIKGIVMASGLFDSMFKGKEVIMINHCKLYDDYILYNGNSSIKLKTLPHNLGGGCDVKKI